jgi:hypothetical protein
LHPTMARPADTSLRLLVSVIKMISDFLSKVFHVYTCTKITL